MPAIGITGGISTGKTTFCECLRGVMPAALLFDADHAARELADQDPAVQEEIRRAFGADIYSAAGDLNRSRLRAIVLADAACKSVLEQILHPRIRRQWSAQAQTYRQSPDFFFADIPLLYETGGETLCDTVVVVACSLEIQRERLLGRSRLSAREADQMIKSQMPLADKIKRAQHVVWNNDGEDVLAAQAQSLAALWKK
jgi:dephospho-CoA kinase